MCIIEIAIYETQNLKCMNVCLLILQKLSDILALIKSLNGWNETYVNNKQGWLAKLLNKRCLFLSISEMLYPYGY